MRKMRNKIRQVPNQWRCVPVLGVLILGVLVLANPAFAGTINGFDIDDPLIPANEIVSGGPPRDGIPAIDQPRFVHASAVEFLDDDDRLMGLVIGGQARAYPIKILDWHEIVNDRVGNQHIAVTYCPLCGSGIVFATNVNDDVHLNFGVSGLLYDSDVLLYDRNTESLWSQLMGQAISGKLKGTKLPEVPVRHTTWSAWRASHPETLVLSTDTGFARNYDRSPYINYNKTRRLFFDVSNRAPRDVHTKELVLGVSVGDIRRAYPFSALQAQDKEAFSEVFGDATLTIHWDAAARSAWVTNEEGEEIPSTIAYWFAWYTFNPDTELFVVEQ